MVLTPGQQKALFVLVVVVLGALGYFLVVPALHHSNATNKAAASPTPSAAGPSAAAPAPIDTAPPATSGAPGGVDIYAWLPFTQQDLTNAAALTVKFAVEYNTYSYTQDARAYVGTMNGLITTQLADALKAAYATPGVAQLRNDEKQVSTGTAAIHSLRAFGPSSITFLVDTRQHLETSGGASNAGKQYAVTVTGSGTSWLVNDIEPSDAGNS